MEVNDHLEIRCEDIDDYGKPVDMPMAITMHEPYAKQICDSLTKTDSRAGRRYYYRKINKINIDEV